MPEQWSDDVHLSGAKTGEYMDRRAALALAGQFLDGSFDIEDLALFLDMLGLQGTKRMDNPALSSLTN